MINFKDVLKWYKPNSVVEAKEKVINELTSKIGQMLDQIENLTSTNNELFSEISNNKLDIIISKEKIVEGFKDTIKTLLDSGKTIDQIKELSPQMFKMDIPNIDPNDIKPKENDNDPTKSEVKSAKASFPSPTL